MINGNKDNIKNDIPIIKIDDSYAYTTKNKILAHVVIKTQDGEKNYRILRTSNGGNVMQ